MSDLLGIDPNKAITDEWMAWVAYLKGGAKIYEGMPTGVDGNGKPNLSSDFLPSDDVISLGYVPKRVESHPRILCNINLEEGERFVRYWTTLRQVFGAGHERLYALGWYKVVDGEKRYAVLYFYPQHGKVVLCNRRYAGPPMKPDTFALLQEATVIGGPGQGYIGWKDEYFEVYLINVEGGLIFQSIFFN
jgi:hypothetical protein